MLRRPQRAPGGSVAARAAAVAAACLVVAGCFGGGGGGRRAVSPLDAVTDAESAVQIGRLSAQRVVPGECGVFLWSLSASQLILFTSTRTRAAVMSLDGEETSLPRLAASGPPIIAGHVANQTFRSSDGQITAYVQMRRGELVEGGRRISESVLRVIHASGWELVLPVAGIAYCRQRNEGQPSVRR